MKKGKKLVIFPIIALLLVLLSLAAASAEIIITEQPLSQETKVGGQIILSCKATGAQDEPISWYFTDPDAQITVSGKELSTVFSGVKVKNPNSLKITISNIPAEMHGWTAYCHIGRKSTGKDTYKSTITISGMNMPERLIQMGGFSFKIPYACVEQDGSNSESSIFMWTDKTKFTMIQVNIIDDKVLKMSTPDYLEKNEDALNRSLLALITSQKNNQGIQFSKYNLSNRQISGMSSIILEAQSGTYKWHEVSSYHKPKFLKITYVTSTSNLQGTQEFYSFVNSISTQ